MVNDSVSVTFTLSMLNVSLIIASVLYLFCFILAKRKLSSLHDMHPDLSLKKLLLLSVLILSFIRIMTFLGVTMMDIANVRAHYIPNPAHYHRHSHNDSKNGYEKIAHNQSFYDSSMMVLFDLPNAIVVSTYALLTLVWAECFLQSRLHTESTIRWKKRWLKGYAVFNTCLFTTQIILYVLVFWPGTDSSVMVVRTVLYAAMTGINFIAVFLVCLLYFYLSITFAGFPFRSIRAKKSLNKVSNVFFLWSLSRVIYAIAMLIVFISDIELLQDSDSPFWTPVLLFFLLLFCEVSPLLVMLDYSYIQIFRFDDDSGEMEEDVTNLTTNRWVTFDNEHLVSSQPDIGHQISRRWDQTSQEMRQPLISNET